MITHETARRAFATSLDFALEPDDRETLDAHLADCPACRSYVAAVRSDSAVLRELDFGPVPVAVRANIAIAAERPGRGSVGRWIAIVAVGALLLVGIGGGALGIGGQRGTTNPGPSQSPAGANVQIAWKTQVVGLEAREFSILASGLVFRAATPKVDVSSDPGDATYRTLEATWQEHGVEMRLNLYFGGDQAGWWVDEVRIYNGAMNGKWLYAKGPLFKAPLGAAWTGDVDIRMDDPEGAGGTPARIHFAGLTLSTTPADLVNEPPGGGIPLDQNARPFAPGQPLHCSGILVMEPAQAQSVLLSLGYRVGWRHYINDGTYVELLREPPSGTVIMAEEPAVGTEGQILIPIVDARVPGTDRATHPDDCPRADPNLTPPPPAP